MNETCPSEMTAGSSSSTFAKFSINKELEMVLCIQEYLAFSSFQKYTENNNDAFYSWRIK